MKHLTNLAVAGMACLAALGPPPARGAAADWKTVRNDAGDYAARIPASMLVNVPHGTTCAAGVCQRVEQVSLGLGDGQSITWSIQRNINPQHLTIRQLYQSLAHRALDPEKETLITFGGRPAIHRGPTTPGVTIHTVNGKEVSRQAGPLPDDTIFATLNDSDLLSVSITATTPAGKAAFDQVLASVRFSR